MTPKERQSLRHLDEMVLNASPEELVVIQKIDSVTQLKGLSLCDVYEEPTRT